MAELPVAKRARYLGLGLPKADVLILADELATADFFDATMAAGAPAKAAANWIMGDIMAACKVRRLRRAWRGWACSHVGGARWAVCRWHARLQLGAE